jgi:hypothetical protein
MDGRPPAYFARCSLSSEGITRSTSVPPYGVMSRESLEAINSVVSVRVRPQYAQAVTERVSLLLEGKTRLNRRDIPHVFQKSGKPACLFS